MEGTLKCKLLMRTPIFSYDYMSVFLYLSSSSPVIVKNRLRQRLRYGKRTMFMALGNRKSYLAPEYDIAKTGENSTFTLTH